MKLHGPVAADIKRQIAREIYPDQNGSGLKHGRQRLIANGVSARRRAPWQKDWSDEPVIQDMLDFPLAVNWAAALLGGRSFGTGNYSMYGAFAVDLVAETVTDDPKASPVVRNIEIDGVSRAPGRFDP